jgi:fibrillarin-like pre-rRNA processing protein
MQRLEERFPGVYSIDRKLATRNLVKGRRVYAEDLVTIDKMEYRMWTPYRSKLSAAIMNGMKNMGIKEGSSVLYLGAANGTTASHVSDIVGNSGSVYCVEMSERSMRDLIRVCETRRNMLPILADAEDVGIYKDIVAKCDFIYQDVSARNQAEILNLNSMFLNAGGLAYFAIKSQSIDISMKPEDVYEKELKVTERYFDVIERLSLEPYDSMHLFAVLKKKGR